MMQTTKVPTNHYALTIIGILFFTFGFVTWLNGSLIPFLKLACELKSDTQAFLVTSAFYMSYFFLAIPSSYILKATGLKNGMAFGLFVMAIGSLIFIPAANGRNFALFLTGLFVQGMGLSILQTAVYPFLSVIGPIEGSASRISLMGICNKAAGMISPLVVGALVLKNATGIEEQVTKAVDIATKERLLNDLAARVIMPYIIMAIILILLAIMVRFSKLPEIKEEAEPTDTNNNIIIGRTSVFQFPHLLLGVLCIFLYVGVEVMAGDAIGTYGKSMGMPLDITKNFTSFTLCAMLVGYVVGIFTIPKFISQQKALLISAILGIVLTLMVYFTTGYASIVCIALLGLANALMWPAIFPLAIAGLGKFTKIGSALLIMGIAGGAIVPLLYGALKNPAGSFRLSNSASFVICMLPCYLYIAYYSVKGHIDKYVPESLNMVGV